MGLYEIIQACAGKTFSAGELTEILTHRLEKTTFNGPNGNEDTLGALLDERQDLLGKQRGSISGLNLTWDLTIC